MKKGSFIRSRKVLVTIWIALSRSFSCQLTLEDEDTQCKLISTVNLSETKVIRFYFAVK